MEETSTGRSKRQKIDRHGRSAAFEKLKLLKGSKRKYEVDTLENVYDTVDEREYTDRVLQRQDDDWIEDDDGCGYVEDGREIFDDDEGGVDQYSKGSSSKDNDNRAKKRKARVSALGEGGTSSKGNIRNMLSNMTGKKKEDVKISDDDILLDIMSELKSDAPLSSTLSTAKKNSTNILRSSNFVQHSKKEAQDYFKSLGPPKLGSVKPINPFSVKSKAEPKEKDSIIKIEEDDKDVEIFDVPSPKKPKTMPPPAETVTIKVEQDSPTQRIEEFNSQDLHFDDIDFDDTISEKPVKPERLSDGKSAAIEVEGLNADDFLESNFDMSDKKVAAAAVAPEMTHDISIKSDNVNGWNGMAQMDTSSPQTFECTSLPLTMDKNGDKVLRFYWWDAWEDRYMKPGVVFLFGKVYVDPSNPASGCVSCCVTVRNIDRKLYLLPREYKLDAITLEEDGDSPVSIMDVYEEFNSKVSSRLGIKEFKSRKVVKNYSFDLPNIPAQSDYLEVKYAATHPVPPTDKPYLTFSHIFGLSTAALEIFLLEQKIKGPCWLEIKNPENVSNKISWCKVEANCLKPEDVSVLRSKSLPPPPIVIATINTRMVMDPKTKLNKIAMLTCLTNNAFEIHKPAPNPPFHQHFCVFTKSTNEIWPMDLKQTMSQYKETKLTKCDSERELLNYFLVQFWKMDPDLVVGHDLQGYQQDLLIGNILDKNIPNWSRLGRLKRTVVPLRKFAAKDAFLGRLVCDIKISAMELIRSRSFDLETLCTNVLKMPEGSRTEIIPDDIFKYYETSRDLLELVSLTMQDTLYILKMMYELNVLPLALQITQIAGNVMSRTLMGGRSERNEFLLLHAFNEKDYIVPDKIIGKKSIKDSKEMEEGNDEDEVGKNLSKKQSQARKKPAYSGGLVLDPKKGFYDSLVLLMDFNSLYPSIIQEYNICFTTIKRNPTSSSDEEINDLVLPESNSDPGILPTQIRKLVESRREVKKLMKVPDLSPELSMQYNIRQLALKLTANSMYGCLGFTYSRFYAKPLAALVTLKGREILINTKELVQRLNYEVIYGDTDSIMINTNCLDYDQVFKIGNEIKKEINKKYRQVELDIDGVFRYLLLLKKKKYAAVLVSKNKNGDFTMSQELKGLDIVRRDWSQLAAESGKFILNQILSEQSADERVESIQTHLIKLRDDLKENKMPLSMLTITKQLTKSPNEYADKNGQPHVQVALRLNSKSGRKFKKGDIVPYLICQDGTTNPAMQRAYHIEELKNNENLKVDVNYYLAHQLHPVISRICDPIDGMDSARIADCLGLDPSAYKQSIKRETNADDTFQLENEKEKYRQCVDFTFTCVNDKCQMENKVRDAFVKVDKDTVSFLDRCHNEKCNLRPVGYLPTILNQLTKQIRSYNAKYYENWLICEDPACTNRTARLPQCFAGGYPLCNLCEKGVMFREYTEKDLYYQISFFHYLFDLNKQNTQKVKISPQIMSAFHCLKEAVEDALSQSSYSVIHLNQLFSFFDIKSKSSVTTKAEPVSMEAVPPDVENDEYNTYMDIGAY